MARRTQTRIRILPTDAQLAANAAQPVDERARLASLLEGPGTAGVLRLAMADAHLYPTFEQNDERMATIYKADLHRFIDAMSATDLWALHKLVASLLRFPFTAALFEHINRRSAAFLARYDAEHPKPKRTRVPKVFRDFISGLDL